LQAASANIDELEPGTSFIPVLSDTLAKAETVEKVVFLSGKMYYDLVKEREERGLVDKIAFIRLEASLRCLRLYPEEIWQTNIEISQEISPFAYKLLEEAVKPFSNAKSFVWAQEEPENAGAYTFVAPRLAQILPSAPIYVGRDAMSTPAPGVGSYFAAQKKEIMNKIFE
jgi:probable 2-oxoglutarate dehydrogenase E1 component DHKTD1